MKRIKIHPILAQRFTPLIMRGHGSAHGSITRNSKGVIIRMTSPSCVNPKCQLNNGEEPHYAPHK